MELQVLCREPRGDKIRTVRNIDRSVGNILDIQERMSGVSNFLSKANPFEVFVSENSQVLQVDNVGILAFADIQRGLSAHVHMTFWDRRLRGREDLIREVAKYGMKEFGLQFVWTAVPKTLKHVIAFAERAGFERFYDDGIHVGLKFDRSEENGN